MASKYAKIFPNLPVLPVENPDYQVRVEEVKTKILGDTFQTHPVTPEDLAGRLENLELDGSYIADMLLGVAEGKRHGNTLVRAYVEARRVKDVLERLESSVNLVIEALTQLAVDQLEVEGTPALKLSSGDSVSDQPEPYAKVEDRDAFREWCVMNGLERSLALPWQTTNSLVKQRLLEGEAEPPGVKCYLKHKLVLRKG